jgi:hypothetical protein
MQKLPVGISDFKLLREADYYFVDKSLFIKEIIDDGEGKIILIPRPRRFGKTLTLSMLRYFFEKPDVKIDAKLDAKPNTKPNTKSDAKSDIKKLFSGLLIEKEEIFKTHICKYPVIYLTFKDIKSLAFENALESIKRLIAKEFRRHSYLLKSDGLDAFEKEDFNNIASSKANISLFETSLKDLSHYIYKHHNQKPIILIDEYDTPIHTAYIENYYDEIIAFFRSFLGAGLKDNPNIFKGVLTGILRVAKESIFSGMNNLGVYSILREEYSEFFGFTEKEVVQICWDYDIKDKIEEIKKWYDGYIFGKNVIYNPWSIINFIYSKDKEYRPYWANTASNEIIKKLVINSPNKVKEEIYDLLKNIPVTKRIEENIVFSELIKNEANLYSFLLFCGYLKAFDKKHIQRKSYYNLLIPNIEVKQIFEDVIFHWIEESYESYKLRDMLKALLSGDVEIFEEILGDFILETLSYFDTGRKNVEKVYQAFILGLLVNLSPYYEVNSEKESGYGRYDISIIPKDKTKKAIIMELKTIRKNETKDEALESALNQIEERKYETEILKRGINDIDKLAVVFDGKRVWVRQIRKNRKG